MNDIANRSFSAPVETLSIRRTHLYVGSYAHLDHWDDIGTFTLLSTRPAEATEDEDDAIVVHHRVLVEAEGAENADIAQALIDSNSKVGCAHTYDCCGCASQRAGDPTHIRGDIWTFDVTTTRNY